MPGESSKTVGALKISIRPGLIVKTANADGDPAADGIFLNSWSLQEGVSKGPGPRTHIKE
jgi:hypothetical protein